MKKSILQKILAALARATIRRYKPLIIGVTGSVGKTSTRLAIFAVVNGKYRAATAEKNYNNEIGLPLAILGIPHYGRNVFAWGAALASAAMKAYGLAKTIGKYPEVLVLEYGVDRPGDMDMLLKIARPSIGVVTAIGDVPAHVEFFSDPGEVIREKAKLIRALPADGYAILNHDDDAVLDMGEGTLAHPLTFGIDEDSDVRMANYKLLSVRAGDGTEMPEGITCKFAYRGSEVPVRLDGVFGMPHAYAAAAAAAVGAALGMNLVRSKSRRNVGTADAPVAHRTSHGMNLIEIAEALRAYTPPPGRMRLLKGNRNSYILDDTYNAAPESMRTALDTLEMLPGARKIAILGDMRELGRYSEAAHRAIGDQAAAFVDLLFCVGPAARFISDEAKTRGVEHNPRLLSTHQVFTFDDAAEAGRALEPMLRRGDVILVKGSQSMRMERVVEEIMADPEHAQELLVRQEGSWKNLSSSISHGRGKGR